MSLSQSTVGAEVVQLRDRSQITDLVYRLGMRLDEGRFDELRSLFIEEATVRTPGGLAEGREALVAQASRNHPPDERIQHVITNVLIDLDGDRANVRANLVVHSASLADGEKPAPAPPVRYSLGEVYHFGAVRTGDGWRLSRVEAVPVWMSGSRPPAPQPS